MSNSWFEYPNTHHIVWLATKINLDFHNILIKWFTSLTAVCRWCLFASLVLLEGAEGLFAEHKSNFKSSHSWLNELYFSQIRIVVSSKTNTRISTHRCTLIAEKLKVKMRLERKEFPETAYKSKTLEESQQYSQHYMEEMRGAQKKLISRNTSHQ